MTTSKAALIILRKEVRESLRDRKTLIVMVLLPLLLYPLLFLGISAVSMMQHQKLEASEVVVGVQGPMPKEVLEAIGEAPATSLKEVKNGSSAVADGRVTVAILASEEASGFDEARAFPIRVLLDGGSDASREGEKRIAKALAALRKDIQNERLEARGLTREFIEPMTVEVEDVAPPLRQGGWLLGQVLPMLICLLMIGATFYPAIDLTAGEKERGTLQTLLTAPVSPTAIVLGKYLAVVVLGMLTAFINLSAIALVLASIPLPDSVSGKLSFGFGIDVFLLSLVCLVLIGMVFGALMMAVAVTAKSFKEAQNYLTPLYLVCVFPLMLTSLPGIQLNEMTAALPLVNLALCIKQLLVGDLPAGLFFVVIVTTTAWITLAVMLATRVFRMESVLLGHDGVSALFVRRHERISASPRPTIGEVSTLLGINLLLLFYVGLAMQDLPVVVQIHATQWGLLLLPSILLVKYLKVDFRRSFALRAPPFWAMAVAGLCGGGLWFVALSAIEHLGPGWTPVSNPALDQLQEDLAMLASEPIGAVFLFSGMALAPAIAEEFLFRGLVLGALRDRFHALPSVLLSALLFGLFHLNIYQLPTAFVVGIVLAVLTLLSGSIWPAVLLHLLHNGLALGVQLTMPSISETMGLVLMMLPVLGLALLATVGVSRRAEGR